MSTTTSRSVPTSRTIEVDFLYLDLTTCSRCRASDATLDAAVEFFRPVLDSVGAGIAVRKTLVETEEQARAFGFVSSPTTRVNGRDIADELTESSFRGLLSFGEKTFVGDPIPAVCVASRSRLPSPGWQDGCYGYDTQR